jgi:TolA-binding protein
VDSEGSEESGDGKKKSTQDSDSSSTALKKARSKKKSRHHDSTSVSKGQTVLQKKEKEDLEERKDMEKNLSRLTTQLAALQERMYSIRFDDSVELEQKHLELRNFANQILFCERQIALAYREAIEVFEDQLQLHEIGLDGVLDPIHAAEVSDAEINRTGSFMRTPSTQTVQGQDPRKKWQAAFKMYKEKKDQTAVAQGQYVATRDSSLTDLDEEITKLRNAVMALRGRKNLNPRDERTLELMQEQLKVRVQQKERAARQILGSH